MSIASGTSSTEAYVFRPFDLRLVRIDGNDRVSLPAKRPHRAVTELPRIGRRPDDGDDFTHLERFYLD